LFEPHVGFGKGHLDERQMCIRRGFVNGSFVTFSKL
jgi:hypothetical protein